MIKHGAKITTLIAGDSILSGLRENKMSRRKLIKIRTFPGAAIQNIRFFIVPNLKENPEKIVRHVRTNDAHMLPLKRCINIL